MGRHTHRVPAHLSAIATAAVLTACGAAPTPDDTTPIPYAVGPLEIHPLDPPYLCEGTLQLLAAELDRIDGTFHPTWPSDPIAVHLGPDARDGCDFPTPVLGCLKTTDGQFEIFASLDDVFSHELVHAARISRGYSGAALFEEGLAETYAEGYLRQTPRWLSAKGMEPSPTASLGLEPIELNFSVAWSFSRWLKDTEGEDALLAFVDEDVFLYAQSASTEAVEQTFADHFGRSIADAQAQWLEAGPDPAYVTALPPFQREPWTANGIAIDGTIRCDDPRVIGPDLYDDGSTFGVYAFAFDVPASATYSLSFDAPADVHLTLFCANAPEDDPGADEEAIELSGDQRMPVALARCEWIGRVSAPLQAEQKFSLAITP